MLSKSQMDNNIRSLGKAIDNCDFKGTAEVYSVTLRELVEAYNQSIIDYDEYSQELNRAIKLLKESNCHCTKMKK